MSTKVIFFDLGETLITGNRTWINGAKPLLAALKGKGLKLGIISNTGTLRRPAIIRQRLPPDFDLRTFEENLIIFSAEVGMEKPNPQIFRLAQSRSGVGVHECLFCTEDAVDTLAAQEIGFRALRLLPPPNSDVGELTRFLQESGLVT